MERFEGQSDRKLLLACLPFAPPERIAGAWVTGFETNEFYEGERAAPSLIHRNVGHTQLEIDEAKGPVEPTPRLYQMEFVGRRSQCDGGFPRHTIIVDKIISKTESAAG
jgi:hypothetical protein